MFKKISLFAGVLIVCVTASLLITCKKSNDTASATCSDGIQNQGETGVDCGGPCAACSTASTTLSCTVNATCRNGQQDAGETGRDCGGSCNPCLLATAGQVMAIIDGCQWTASTVDLLYTGSALVFKSSSTNPAVSLQINYSGSVMTGTNAVINSATVTLSGTAYTFSNNGGIQFSLVDNVNKKMEGFFWFYGYNGSTKKCVSNGSFKSITYHP